ncbi:MAG TPA: NUDIX domain-containing protein [Bacillales bacterium]|nr:NUDIX domain-containing protein [Bacillales bacterium]
METTWDGMPISKEKPHGTAIVVYRKTENEPCFLILHRSHVDGEDYEGDWAWGPPAGARLPGEPVETCMKRELLEETGLKLKAKLTEIGDESWYVYYAEAPKDAKITLSEEHDKLEWLPAHEAASRCLPSFIGEQIRRTLNLIK